MKLYLCRHAAAEDTASGGDSARGLTHDGKKDFARVAHGLAALHPRIDLIFTSPYLRAQQTAEILAEILAPERSRVDEANVPIISADELACGGRPELLLTRVRAAQPRPQAVLAVGHEPDLSGFLGRLCFGRTGQVRFKKGGLACIEMDETLTHGELLFLMQPSQLGRM